MRLIDADALKEYIDAQKGRPFICCTVGEAFKIMTDEQPTVEAIPVEWIKQYGDLNWFDYGTQHNAITCMLKAWEERKG